LHAEGATFGPSEVKGSNAVANRRLGIGLGLMGVAVGIRVVGFFDSFRIEGPQPAE